LPTEELQNRCQDIVAGSVGTTMTV